MLVADITKDPSRVEATTVVFLIAEISGFPEFPELFGKSTNSHFFAPDLFADVACADKQML